MDLDELERIAMRGGPMPAGLTLPNQVYFQGLSYLYARFRAGFIDRDCGSAEKGKMLYQRDLAHLTLSYIMAFAGIADGDLRISTA